MWSIKDEADHAREYLSMGNYNLDLKMESFPLEKLALTCKVLHNPYILQLYREKKELRPKCQYIHEDKSIIFTLTNVLEDYYNYLDDDHDNCWDDLRWGIFLDAMKENCYAILTSNLHKARIETDKGYVHIKNDVEIIIENLLFIPVIEEMLSHPSESNFDIMA